MNIWIKLNSNQGSVQWCSCLPIISVKWHFYWRLSGKVSSCTQWQCSCSSPSSVSHTTHSSVFTVVSKAETYTFRGVNPSSDFCAAFTGSLFAKQPLLLFCVFFSSLVADFSRSHLLNWECVCVRARMCAWDQLQNWSVNVFYKAQTSFTVSPQFVGIWFLLPWCLHETH